MAGKHRNLVHVGRLSQRREIPHLHVLNHALSKWCHHRKLLCEIEFAAISNSIVSQRAFSAKKISDESEITEEWKEVSGRRTTSRSCYYRDSGLVQNALCDTRKRFYVYSVRELPRSAAAFSGGGHDLHQTERAGPAPGVGIEARLLEHLRRQQPPVEFVLRAVFLHDLVVVNGFGALSADCHQSGPG